MSSHIYSSFFRFRVKAGHIVLESWPISAILNIFFIIQFTAIIIVLPLQRNFSSSHTKLSLYTHCCRIEAGHTVWEVPLLLCPSTTILWLWLWFLTAAVEISREQPKIELDFGQLDKGRGCVGGSLPITGISAHTQFSVQTHVMSYRDFYAHVALKYALKMCLPLMCLQSRTHIHTHPHTQMQTYIFRSKEQINKQISWCCALHALILQLTLNTWAPALGEGSVEGGGEWVQYAYRYDNNNYGLLLLGK